MVLNSALTRTASTSTIDFHPFTPNVIQPSYLLFYYFIIPNVMSMNGDDIKEQSPDTKGNGAFQNFLDAL